MKSASDPTSGFFRPVPSENEIEVSAPHEVVFNVLADIERIPRWAPGFCERIYLARGGWMALTALGEMALAVNSDPRTGRIALRAGWETSDEMTVEIRIGPTSNDATRILVLRGKNPGETEARLYRALEADFHRLPERLAYDSCLLLSA